MQPPGPTEGGAMTAEAFRVRPTREGRGVMSDKSPLDANAARGEAAGVPFVAIPPQSKRDQTPTVVIWHMHDPPRSETAMAAALPLQGLDAWRVYLGVPLSGTRL